LRNILLMLTAEEVEMGQEFKSESKEVAPANMAENLVTDLTFHALMSWLKDVASRNMETMFVTELTSQSPMSPLKEVARRNMPVMSTTADVFQAFKLLSNVGASANMDCIVVTFETC